MQLDLRLSDLKEIPESVFRAERVTSLNLEFNEISEIPDRIVEMQGLEELLLGYNRIREINPLVFQLPKLRRLRLSRNCLDGVMKCVEFGAGPDIELDVSHNQLDGFAGFAGSPRLVSLNACYNRLADLGSGLFADSPRLEVLHLGNNKLSLIPMGIFGAGGLQYLSLPYNSLQAIHSEPPELSKLRVLHAQGNRLRAIPCGMEMLEELIAHENRFSQFPDCSAGVQLRHVDLTCNQIECIPDWLRRHAALYWLILSRNRIECLPDFLLQAQHLQYLSLADNPLKQIPSVAELGSMLQFQKDKPRPVKLRIDLQGHSLPQTNELGAYSPFFDVCA